MTKDTAHEREALEGLVLDGKYQIKRLLGEGGMGAVYEAYHCGIDRKLAVKVLHSDVGADDTDILRFQREARITGALDHENIIQVTDTGTTPGGAPYIVMEFLVGQSFGDVLGASGPLSLTRVLEVFTPVLDALAVVHEAGIVHRDLKPDNIFLATQTRSGKKQRTVVKLLDFGISKPVDASAGSQSLTQTGSIIGTPIYMSPEQIRAQTVDHRTDIYAVGVMLYEALTGRRPFEASTFSALCAAVLVDEVAPLTLFRNDLPAQLETVVHRAFARDPDERFASAEELLGALVSAAEGGHQLQEGGHRSPGPRDSSQERQDPSQERGDPSQERRDPSQGHDAGGGEALEVSPARPSAPPAAPPRPVKWKGALISAFALAIILLGALVGAWIIRGSAPSEVEAHGDERPPEGETEANMATTIPPASPAPSEDPAPPSRPDGGASSTADSGAAGTETDDENEAVTAEADGGPAEVATPSRRAERRPRRRSERGRTNTPESPFATHPRPAGSGPRITTIDEQYPPGNTAPRPPPAPEPPRRAVTPTNESAPPP